MFPFLRKAFLAVTATLALVAFSRADDGDEHIVMGNPSGAVADPAKRDNYLLKKPQYALSYNSSKGTANWVSWRLNKSWLGKTRRGNPFAPDLTLPDGFVVIRPNDYRAGGFDRGHLCPAADRSVSAKDMDSTFTMSNMVPQSPDLNRKTWERLEAYCRDQAREDKELFIVAGPAGRGGIGSDGERTHLNGKAGKITVPAKCWKVVLVLPPGVADPKKVTAANARVFAAIFPNIQGLETDWRKFAAPVTDVEKLTGYTFFGNLPQDVAKELRERKPETRASSTTAGTKEKPPRRGELTGVLPAFEKGCIIGNKSTKIFHVPGGSGYERAKESKNAIFFSTAKDAEKAGYRASKR
jgi:endonuclease G